MEVKTRTSHREYDYREKHGLRYTNIYHVWLQMIQRCYNKKNKGYPSWGGRGILVCDQWRSSFINFYNDTINDYRNGFHIDRKDNNGPYSKENCRWVINNVNMANRRNFGKYMKGVVGRSPYNGKFLSRITIDGKKYCVGTFNTEIEAHNAFMKIHMEWYGA